MGANVDIQLLNGDLDEDAIVEFCVGELMDQVDSKDLNSIPGIVRRILAELKEKNHFLADYTGGLEGASVQAINEYLSTKNKTIDFCSEGIYENQTLLVLVPVCKKCGVVKQLKDETKKI